MCGQLGEDVMFQTGRGRLNPLQLGSATQETGSDFPKKAVRILNHFARQILGIRIHDGPMLDR